MPQVPASTRKITPEWLTDALCSSGKLSSSVTNLELEPIGEGVGLMGELGRLHLAYEDKETLPGTIVAKCAAQNENRQVAQVLDFYNREANFYNRIAEDCPLRVPGSYYADVDQKTYDFVLLMDDLGDVSPRDQLVGASEEEVYAAVGNVAEMHAIWWGATSESHPWMYDMMSETEAGKLQEVLYKPALEPAIEKFDYILNDDAKSILREVGNNFGRYWAQYLSSADTFVHGDYRQDNMLYPDSYNEKAFVMDWQISGRGKPVFDVAYFMCQSITSEMRGEIERDLLKFYVGRLAEHGVDYAFDDCFEDYRRLVLGCLVYPVTVCGTLDLANERGKALGETMMIRNLKAIEDLGSRELIS